MNEYYTQEERKGMVEVLKGARQLIADRKENFVCCAVSSVGKGNPSVGRYVILVDWHINKLLDGIYTLNRWLDTKHGINIESGYCPQYQEKIRTTRLAWIDNMIKELS